MRLALLAAAFAAFSTVSLAETPQKTFIVPADDGYGMDDCMADGGACAKLVVDSWCQVKGMGHAASYSLMDPADITASLSSNSTKKALPVSYLVTCQD